MSLRLTALVIFAIFIALGLDVSSDFKNGSALSHVILELFAFACSGALLINLFRTFAAEKQSLQSRLEKELGQLSKERDEWRQLAGDHLRGLGAAIDKQFDSWKLSPSEREIALLILKGLSHKEIADLRGTSEKTVRQQAGVIYSKSGMAGKAQLAAFFLEDLILPTSLAAN